MPARRVGDTDGGSGLDTIFIERLEVDTIIGVYEWEHRAPQRLFIDLQIGASIRAAAADDDVLQTIDYEAVANRVRDFAAEARYALVETLAEETARLVLADFDVTQITVRVTKPGALAQAAGVGVEITRLREE